jgi:cell division protein FtsB
MAKRNYVNVKGDRSSRSPFKKRLVIASGVLVGIYLLVSFIFGEMGVVKYYRMKLQYRAVNDEITALRQANVKLSREVRSLKTDAAYLERIARDKLGLARPGEIVYYYGEP